MYAFSILLQSFHAVKRMIEIRPSGNARCIRQTNERLQLTSSCVRCHVLTTVTWRYVMRGSSTDRWPSKDRPVNYRVIALLLQDAPVSVALCSYAWNESTSSCFDLNTRTACKMCHVIVSLDQTQLLLLLPSLVAVSAVASLAGCVWRSECLFLHE